MAVENNILTGPSKNHSAINPASGSGWLVESVSMHQMPVYNRISDIIKPRTHQKIA